MNNNVAFRAARKDKNDEFYTQLVDIENEMKHYSHHFKGKSVLCNCDDPRVSNFFHYFSYNFEHLGLKKLVTTCYKNDDINIFSKNTRERGIFLEYNGDKNRNKIPDAEEIGVTRLKCDGDFRNAEAIELLKQADIVVTNPPFSLFREYVSQLAEYKRKFLIIGSLNAITYKNIFNMVQSNKIWLGASIKSGDREFGVPDSYPLTASSSRTDDAGKKFVRVKGVRWWTNLDYQQRHEDLVLYKKYTSQEYPRYDNCDAINVDKTKDIPKDYEGCMGVPISFIDKHNPNQFDIMGLDDSKGWAGWRPVLNGKSIYRRILIKRNKKL